MVKLNNCSSNFNKKGFTLIESIVGVAIFGIVFVGILGAYRLGLKAVGLSKNKITATAIANSQIEKIRGFPYLSIGIKDAVLPLVSGDIDPVATQIINGVTFTISTEVSYVVDPTDGTGEADACDWDYKKVDVTVSWGNSFPGSINISTNISPESQTQEAQTCLNQPGGILEVTVFDSLGMIVESPFIQIYKMPENIFVDSAIPNNGSYPFPLELGIYRIMVSKNDYTGARTYDSSEVAVPDNPDLAVYEGKSTQKSLSIDRVAAISVDGFSPVGVGDFSDSFSDQSQISDISNAQIIDDSVKLSGPPYVSAGYAISSEISPDDLVAWKELTFSNSCPESTAINYQVLFFNGLNWDLVPDIHLGGNSEGLTSSPIQLSGLSTGDYPRLKIKANLLSADELATSHVDFWQLTWTSASGASISSAAFHLRGDKTIGKNLSGEDVYKYSHDLALDVSGHLDLPAMDPDNYTFSVDPSSGFSLAGTDPLSQPIGAISDVTTNVKIYLESQNAILLTVQDSQSLNPIFSTTVCLANVSLGYDNTQYTDENGQVYFAPLSNGVYDLLIKSDGYSDYSGVVDVLGQTTAIINLDEI